MFSMSFNTWMEAVNKAIQEISGCSVHDLSDYTLRDLYEDGVSPHEAAARILEDEELYSAMAAILLDDYD